MVLTLGQKTTEVPKLSYLHISRLKKHNRNHEKLFNYTELKALLFITLVNQKTLKKQLPFKAENRQTIRRKGSHSPRLSMS